MESLADQLEAAAAMYMSDTEMEGDMAISDTEMKLDEPLPLQEIDDEAELAHQLNALSLSHHHGKKEGRSARRNKYSANEKERLVSWILQGQEHASEMDKFLKETEDAPAAPSISAKFGGDSRTSVERWLEGEDVDLECHNDGGEDEEEEKMGGFFDTVRNFFRGTKKLYPLNADEASNYPVPADVRGDGELKTDPTMRSDNIRIRGDGVREESHAVNLTRLSSMPSTSLVYEANFELRRNAFFKQESGRAGRYVPASVKVAFSHPTGHNDFEYSLAPSTSYTQQMRHARIFAAELDSDLYLVLRFTKTGRLQQVVVLFPNVSLSSEELALAEHVLSGKRLAWSALTNGHTLKWSPKNAQEATGQAVCALKLAYPKLGKPTQHADGEALVSNEAMSMLGRYATKAGPNSGARLAKHLQVVLKDETDSKRLAVMGALGNIAEFYHMLLVSGTHQDAKQRVGAVWEAPVHAALNVETLFGDYLG